VSSGAFTLELDTTPPDVEMVRGGRIGSEAYVDVRVDEPAVLSAEAHDSLGNVIPMEASGNRVWTNVMPEPGIVHVLVTATDDVLNARTYDFVIVVGDGTLRSWTDDLVNDSDSGHALHSDSLAAADLTSSLSDPPTSGSEAAGTLRSGTDSG
jgi:hypothetical protein